MYENVQIWPKQTFPSYIFNEEWLKSEQSENTDWLKE